MIIDSSNINTSFEERLRAAMQLKQFIEENNAKIVTDENEEIYIVYGENKKPYFKFFNEIFEKVSKCS